MRSPYPYRPRNQLTELDTILDLEHGTEQPLEPAPTPEEMHEAELNPWTGHTLTETVARNRAARQAESPPA